MMNRFILLQLALTLAATVCSQDEFIHTTTEKNISSENSFFYHPDLDFNKNAVVIAIQLDESRSLNPKNTGVWFSGAYWGVFNQDKSRMPAGVRFRIIFAKQSGEKAFTHMADKKNISHSATVLDHPLLNKNPEARIIMSPVFNPGGVGGIYNDNPVVVAYNSNLGKWEINNTNTVLMPEFASFNILLPAIQNEQPAEYTHAGPLNQLQLQLLNDTDFPNPGFEKGLSHWTAVGNAFNNQPTYGDNVSSQRVLPAMEYASGGVGGDYWKNQGYPNGYKEKFWIGTYENNPEGKTFLQVQGDALTGILTSDSFLLTKKFCSFLIGGGADPQKLKVELEIFNNGNWSSVASRTSFRNTELMYREVIDIRNYKGSIARIRITDMATGPWGHINADDFRFTDSISQVIEIRDPQTGKLYLIDEDTPVWGFADTHAHPASNKGFGNKLLLGNANDPMDKTYHSDLCRSHHSMAGGLMNSAFIGQADAHEMSGWPDFIGFPRFTSKTHQQQHVDFLKRAWQGGLRLYCALAVNNMFLPTLGMGPGNDGTALDDETVILKQIEEIKKMAAAQNSWMEIAYTAKDARRIIHQGKLALVLGVEMDNFGNFKSETFNWNDRNGRDKPFVLLNETNADQLLKAKLDQYHSLGIRQITAIHYISGLFGGAAVFRGETSLVQFAFNNRLKVKGGVSKNIPYNLYTDFSPMAVFLGSGLTYGGFVSKILKADNEAEISTINAEQLTPVGAKLINSMMEKGMIIDSEHMGYETKNDLFQIARQKNYPVISSHTDPHGISFNWREEPVRFEGTDEFKLKKFGTTDIRNIGTEGQLAEEHFKHIRESGGTVGLLMLPYRKRQVTTGSWGVVANTCDGSTRTWAQMYLHSLNQMQGTGVALSSDRGMVDFIAPRFGPLAAYTLKSEKTDALRITERNEQRFLQRNGVKYDRSMQSFHPSWFEHGDVSGEEEDAWKAWAAWEANVPQQQIPNSSDFAHWGRIRNYISGLKATHESQLEQPALFNSNGDAPWEQAVMFCLKNNRAPASLQRFAGYRKDEKDRLLIFYNKLEPAWKTWLARSGINEPLRRYKTGNRDWDFNTDGMAHYGLMPDFMQDLKNIGLSPLQLTPLFRSAEDYIRMWEKTEQAAAAIRAKSVKSNMR